MNEDIFEKLKEHYPDTWVTRKELKKITGGLICGGTMGRLDHEGKGVKNRTVISGRTVYHINDLVEWLKNNVEIVDSKNLEEK